MNCSELVSVLVVVASRWFPGGRVSAGVTLNAVYLHKSFPWVELSDACFADFIPQAELGFAKFIVN
jgi:hypothetical protein